MSTADEGAKPKKKGIQWDESIEEAMNNTLTALEREDSFPIKGPLKMMDSLEVTRARMQKKATGEYESSSEEEDEEDEMQTDDPLGLHVHDDDLMDDGSKRPMMGRHVSFQVGGKIKQPVHKLGVKGASFAHAPRAGGAGMGSVRFEVPAKEKKVKTLEHQPSTVNEGDEEEA